MPGLRFKEVRLPELHLPEMSRDDIARAIGDARKDVTLDRVDLTRLDPRQSRLADIDLPHVDLPKVDLSKLELPRIEVPKAIVDAGVAAGLVKRRRSRWPYLIGAVFGLALLGFALSQLPMVRQRLEEARRRREADGMMGGGAPLDEGPRAFDAAVAVPIEPAAYADSAPDAGTPYDGSAPLPEGFGDTVADQSPAAAGENPPQA